MTSAPVYSSWQTCRGALAGITVPLRAPFPGPALLLGVGSHPAGLHQPGLGHDGRGFGILAWQWAHNAPVSSGRSSTWLELWGENPISLWKLSFYVECTWAVERDNFPTVPRDQGQAVGKKGRSEVGRYPNVPLMFYEWEVTGMLRINSVLSPFYRWQERGLRPDPCFSHLWLWSCPLGAELIKGGLLFMGF